jgi:hypothetical protein
MAPVVDSDETRLDVRWWDRAPGLRLSLEGDSLRLDRTIHRLTADEVEANRDLRVIVELLSAETDDLLAYSTHAEGPYGRYRLVAVFVDSPDVCLPMVLCLDGPRGRDASEHRYNDVWLCLYYPKDPDERRWKNEDGLLRLFDLARLHLFGEYRWRETGSWPIEEAPHGECAPAVPNPSLRLAPLVTPGRNDLCPCGSGTKAKRCCYR